MSVSTGMTIGKYELGNKLGQGGFGSVFVARDTSLEREVAIKLLHAEHMASTEVFRRFLQEARSAAKVVHAGIVTVFECGQLPDGVAFIAMELLHGESLTSRLSRRGRLAPAAAVEIARQIASALEAAHQAGIVHRDLKPDNIFLVTDAAMPSGERVKVLDFGIAKLAQPETSGVHTHSMMVFGTPRYMSPEQCRSSANIDHRSDIYSLGCILFELVVGRAPFDGEVGELIAKHQMVAPPTARSERPELPAALDDLIAKMLAKDPAQRPQTMMAVQRALAGEPEVSGIEPTLPPTLGDLARYTPVPKSILGPAPVAASATTLGNASGQRDSAAAKPTSKKPVVIGGVAVAAIAGIALWFGLARSGSDTRPAEPPIGAIVAQPPPPPPPQPIVVELTSTPAAEVYSADRRLLGTTPFTYRRAPAEGQLVFFVTAEGYIEQRVEMPADRSDTHAVTLDAIPKPVATVPAAVVAKPKPARPTNAAKKPLRPGELPDEQ